MVVFALRVSRRNVESEYFVRKLPSGDKVTVSKMTELMIENEKIGGLSFLVCKKEKLE